jgi:hypothetical protein
MSKSSKNQGYRRAKGRRVIAKLLFRAAIYIRNERASTQYDPPIATLPSRSVAAAPHSRNY